jgi:hypothetical protein
MLLDRNRKLNGRLLLSDRATQSYEPIGRTVVIDLGYGEANVNCIQREDEQVILAVTGRGADRKSRFDSSDVSLSQSLAESREFLIGAILVQNAGLSLAQKLLSFRRAGRGKSRVANFVIDIVL